MATMTRPPLTIALSRTAPALESLVEEYLAVCRDKGLSVKTISGVYGYTLRDKFLPWCASRNLTEPDQLSDQLLSRFAGDLREHGGKNGRPLAPHSIKTYVTTVGFFLSWLHETGQSAELSMPSQRVPRKLVDILTRQEVQRLEDAARNERDKLIVRLLADTGVREGELVGLRLADVRDIKQPDRRVLFSLKVTGKGSRDRMVPIQPAMYRRVQAYIQQYRPKDSGSTRLFLASRKRPHGDYAPLTGSGVRQMIGALGEQAGIGKRVYPHLLRHSFATAFLQAGGSALDLAKILGHSSLTMITTVYAHLSDTDSDRAMMRFLTGPRDER